MGGRLARGVVLFSLAAGCKAEKKPAPAPAKGAGAAVSSTGFLDGFKRSTDGTIAVGNLNAQIAADERILSQNPGNVHALSSVAALYQQRAQFLGRLADYDRAAAAAEKRFSLAPDGQGYLDRASIRATFHQFAAALADLDDAQKRGAKMKSVQMLRASILQGMGRTAEALSLRQQITSHVPEIMPLATLAELHAEMGETAQAEALFENAPASYDDVSPFPFAWIDFQRGNLWEKEGKLTKAEHFYRAALERLPAYAPATGHLASVLAAKGQRDQAVALLRPLIQASDDPEYVGELSNLLADTGRTDEAKALREKAAARFQELLKAHPEAFADHAARFYLDVAKDPREAEKLARVNLAARQTRDAYELALQSSLAAKDTAWACELADRAVKQLGGVKQIRYLAGRAYEACGQPARARALQSEAATAAAP